MRIKNSTYIYFFVVFLIAFVAGIAIFLISFNNGYNSYLSCAAKSNNITKGTIPLNDTIIKGQPLPVNVPAKDLLYYECGWHWIFKPSQAPLFELLFALGTGVLLACVLIYAFLSKPRKPQNPGTIVGANS